jgi:hypothetical protein
VTGEACRLALGLLFLALPSAWPCMHLVLAISPLSAQPIAGSQTHAHEHGVMHLCCMLAIVQLSPPLCWRCTCFNFVNVYLLCKLLHKSWHITTCWLIFDVVAVNLWLQGLRAYESHPRLLAPWHARFLDTVQVGSMCS